MDKSRWTTPSFRHLKRSLKHSHSFSNSPFCANAENFAFYSVLQTFLVWPYVSYGVHTLWLCSLFVLNLTFISKWLNFALQFFRKTVKKSWVLLVRIKWRTSVLMSNLAWIMAQTRLVTQKRSRYTVCCKRWNLVALLPIYRSNCS